MFSPTLLSETRFGLSRNATVDTLQPGFPTETAAGYLTSVAATGTGSARIMQFGLKFLF